MSYLAWESASCLVMHAFVRFRDDNAKVIVPCNDIKNFNPTGLADFNARRWYDVWWKDNNQSGYYRAQIIKIFGNDGLIKFKLIMHTPLNLIMYFMETVFRVDIFSLCGYDVGSSRR